MSKRSLVLIAGLVVFSGCFVAPGDFSVRPCTTEADCPDRFYLCVPGLPDGGRVCEVLFPAPGLLGDAGVRDAGKPFTGTPHYCSEVKPLLDKYCVGSCHGTVTSGSGQSGFRLDIYDSQGGVEGAFAKADRIKVRMTDFKDMPNIPPYPSDEERELVGRWVTAGAPLCADGGTN